MSESAPARAPTRSDWLLLAVGSIYKFTLVAFYLITLMTVLKHGDYTLKQLSWVQLIGGIEAAKVLFAALMDGRRSAGGRFRPWLLGAALALSAAFALMAAYDVRQNFPLLLVLCVVLSASGTVYGCAVLGLSCVVLPPRERGFGGVVQTMAARTGKVIGGAAVTWVSQLAGFQAACGLMLVLTLAVLALVWHYREPAGGHSGGGLTALAARFWKFWRQPHTGWQWCALLFLLTLPYAFCAATFVTMLADFGFTPVQSANILSIGIPAACLIVTPLAGALARRIPRRRLFFVLYALQLPLLVSMTLPAQALQFARWLPPAQIIALSLAYTLMMPVLLALLMDKSERQTAALDSSLQFSVILVGSYAAGFTALRMAQNWGYASVYQTAVLLALATGAMLWRYRQWTPQNNPAA